MAVASCQQRSEKCVYTFNKKKDKKKVYKGPKLCTRGAKGSMPRGGESMGVCVFYECQTAGELGTSRWLRLGRKGGEFGIGPGAGS